jgi:hypothetical protein
METKFQTSFIPKKPLQTTPGGAVVIPHNKSHGRGTASLFMIISAIIFACSILSIGGAFGWKQYLLTRQSGYKTDLVQKEKGFDVNHIAELQMEASKLQTAKQLLADRLTSSRIFSVLSMLTAEKVRFTSLDLAQPIAGGPLLLTLIGSGKDFNTVAFQSDVLNHLGDYGLSAVVKNAVINSPSQNGDGTVSFGLTATVDTKVLPSKTQ